MSSIINPFPVTSLFLQLLETSEKLWFSDAFGWYGKRHVTWNGLSTFLYITPEAWLSEFALQLERSLNL